MSKETPTMSGRAPTGDETAFYDAMVAEMQKQAHLHPSIKNIHIIALTARLIGYCIGMCFEGERQLARKLAIENIDRAVEDFKSLLEAQENVQN